MTEADPEVIAALQEADPQKVEELIRAGADIRYRRAEGYDALIDAACGRNRSKLIELLQRLIAHGVELNGVTTYGETAIGVLSHRGCFDAVRVLIDAGADGSRLGWTPLIKAVALGSLEDVRAALATGPPLETKDCWSRTAWLIAIERGDTGIANLLLEHGANTDALGHCEAPPIHFAVGHPTMLRWLLDHGEPVDRPDKFGTTALMLAAERGDLACLQILLEAGADIERNANGTALYRSWSAPALRMLLDSGANPAELSREGRRALLGLPPEPDAALLIASGEEFRRACVPRFGRSNPEPIREPYWRDMIRAGISGFGAQEIYGGSEHHPIWCADRFGQSVTFLPDGRIVLIGGEHEDWYDPDFCIYNDVFVMSHDRSIEIFGYPEAVFPPTDFHTATLIGQSIYVIGSLGYSAARRPGTTPVYRLDTQTFAIEAMPTRGDCPGWIHRHVAQPTGDHEIRVRGGVVITRPEDKEVSTENTHSFALDLRSLQWTRVT